MTFSRARADARDVRRSAERLIRDTLEIRPGETVLISNDVDGDPNLADILRDTVDEAGAIAVVVTIPRISHPGAEIPKILRDAGKASDVWIELNQMYIEGTVAHIEAEAAGLRRFYSLTGMDGSDLVAMIDVNIEAVTRFGTRLVELTTGRSTLRVTCANESDLIASLEANAVEQDTTLMPLGQTHIYPVPSSTRGRLVFDAWAFPPRTAGVLQQPVTVRFDDSGRARLDGDSAAAQEVIRWIDGVGDNDLQWICHVSYGFHPNVLRTHGGLVRDERIFGSLCVGFGTKMPYRSHLDFGLSRPTVQVDDYLLQRDGRYLDDELAFLAADLGVPGYDRQNQNISDRAGR